MHFLVNTAYTDKIKHLNDLNKTYFFPRWPLKNNGEESISLKSSDEEQTQHAHENNKLCNPKCHSSCMNLLGAIYKSAKISICDLIGEILTF